MTEKTSVLPTGSNSGLSGDRSDSNYRWVVCGLLFFATTVNYMDRQVIALLKPMLAKEFGWSQIDYSNIVLMFQMAYAVGLLVVGGLMDRVGVRFGFPVAVILWSMASAAHGLVALIPKNAHVNINHILGFPVSISLGIAGLSVFGFAVARVALGLAESGNFPAAIKTVGEWFPKKERALATGIFNSGANVGAITAPFLVPWVASHWGWPFAFCATAVLDIVWVVMWLMMYRNPDQHPRVSPSELAYINSDQDTAPVRKLPWRALFGYRQTWTFACARFLTDPIWWFYLFWVPPFLNERYGLEITKMGWPLVAIYSMTCVGSVGGGWLSSTLIHRGWSINAARKTAMLICAVCVVPIFMASEVSSLWAAVALIGLAASAHQGFAANIFTIVSDTMPRQAVSSVVGISGMAGAIGGMTIAKSAGYILQWTGSYRPLFIIAASAYLLALLVIHVMLPKLKPVSLD